LFKFTECVYLQCLSPMLLFILMQFLFSNIFVNVPKSILENSDHELFLPVLRNIIFLCLSSTCSCLPRPRSLLERVYTIYQCFYIMIKGTVSVILSDAPCKDVTARFTPVPLTASSDQVWIIYQCSQRSPKKLLFPIMGSLQMWFSILQEII